MLAETKASFSAQMAAATGVGLATFAAVPISTTHAIAGGIAARGVLGKCIVYAWILTFPGAVLVGVPSYLSIHLLLESPVRGWPGPARSFRASSLILWRNLLQRPHEQLRQISATKRLRGC
jgi:hypothetical protein